MDANMQNLKLQHQLATVPEDFDMDFSHDFPRCSSDGDCTETTSTPSSEISSLPSDVECIDTTLISPKVLLLIDWDPSKL